jgi:hypothetical protein
VECSNAPFKEAPSSWIEEKATHDWKMGAYIVNSKINEHVIEARWNQAPLELMFGERPKLKMH